MASGFGSALFALGLGNGSVPAASAGMRSMLAPWIGGAGSPAAPGTPDSGFRSMLAFWAGGAANAGETAQSEARPSGQGNWYKTRQARYRWAEGYRKRKAELLGGIEEESVSAQVAGLLEERESAAEEASLALEQGQDIFLRDALEVIRRVEERLSAMGIVAPAFDTEELDIVYVMMVMGMSDDD